MTVDPQLLTILLALASGYGSLRARLKAVETRSKEHTQHLSQIYHELRLQRKEEVCGSPEKTLTGTISLKE